jgi:hypothetical protein
MVKIIIAKNVQNLYQWKILEKRKENMEDLDVVVVMV